MRSFKEVIAPHLPPAWVLPLRGGSQELPRLEREQVEGTEGVTFPWRERPDLVALLRQNKPQSFPRPQSTECGTKDQVVEVHRTPNDDGRLSLHLENRPARGLGPQSHVSLRFPGRMGQKLQGRSLADEQSGAGRWSSLAQASP